MMQMQKILIVEDEAPIRDMLKYVLENAGFQVVPVATATEGEKFLYNYKPSIILLDWMLPDMSGIELIRRIKKIELVKDTPIIMLTAKAEEENKIKGLNAGADDYVTKPFSPRELIARIKTVLRRGPLFSPEGILKANEINLDAAQRRLTINNKIVKLTKNEYLLLHFFLTHQNRTYTREQLLNFVWGPQTYIDERTVDVQIRRLRLALAKYSCKNYIVTVRGVGYQFAFEG